MGLFHTLWYFTFSFYRNQLSAFVLPRSRKYTRYKYTYNIYKYHLCPLYLRYLLSKPTLPWCDAFCDVGVARLIRSVPYEDVQKFLVVYQ